MVFATKVQTRRSFRTPKWPPWPHFILLSKSLYSTGALGLACSQVHFSITVCNPYGLLLHVSKRLPQLRWSEKKNLNPACSKTSCYPKRCSKLGGKVVAGRMRENGAYTWREGNSPQSLPLSAVCPTLSPNSEKATMNDNRAHTKGQKIQTTASHLLAAGIRESPPFLLNARTKSRPKGI